MKESLNRNTIMEVANRLFYEQGYNSTGTNQIIEEANVARGTFFKYFPKKHDLLLSYIELREKEWLETVSSYIKQYSDPKMQLLALFDFRLDSQLRSNFTGCAFNRICAEVERNDEAAFELLSRQKNAFRSIMRSLATKITEEEPGKFSGEQLGDMIFLILEGATNLGTVNKDAEAVRSARAIAERMLYN